MSTFGLVESIWHFLEIGAERVRLRVVADSIYNLLTFLDCQIKTHHFGSRRYEQLFSFFFAE